MLGADPDATEITIAAVVREPPIRGPFQVGRVSGGYAYSASISASYLRSIGRRFSFIVGVSSSPPGTHSPSSTS